MAHVSWECAWKWPVTFFFAVTHRCLHAATTGEFDTSPGAELAVSAPHLIRPAAIFSQSGVGFSLFEVEKERLGSLAIQRVFGKDRWVVRAGGDFDAGET